MNTNCYCGLTSAFELCCKPVLKGLKKATTAEQLMRSRYTAFATLAADYLVATTHTSERGYHDRSAILHWATSNQWLKLEILKATNNIVEFKAHYLDHNKTPQVHHELSTFVFEEGAWFYVDGTFFS